MTLLILILILISPVCRAASFIAPQPSGHTISINTNGDLLSPTNFFARNSNLIPGANVVTADSFASAVNLGVPTVTTLFIKGFSAKGDGGHGLLYWDSASTAATNALCAAIPYGGATGRLIRPYSGALDVRWFGMRGISDDGTAFTNALSFIAAKGGGELQLAPFTRYDVSSLSTRVGTVSLYQSVFDFTNCTSVVIDGQGSTLFTGSATNYGTFLRFTGCTNPVIRNINFDSGATVAHNDRGLEWIVFRQGTVGFTVENVVTIGGAMAYSCRGAVYTEGGVDSNRTRGGKVLGLTTLHTYYANLFQGAGDDTFGRDIITRDTGRAFYASNARNLDFVIDGQLGASGFSDILINCYGSTNFDSTCENIKVVYNSAGMYPGSPDETAHDTLAEVAAVMYQNGDPQPVVMRNIDIELNVTNTPSSRLQGLFSLVKYKPGSVADDQPRGHTLRNIRVHGSGRGMTNCLLFPIQVCAWSGDNWTGENVSDITLGPLNLDDCYGKLAVFANGAGFLTNRVALTLDRIRTDGYLAIVTNNSPVLTMNCSFTNLASTLDWLTYLNGSTATGAVAQIQTKGGGLTSAGPFTLSGTLTESDTLQVYGGKQIIASAGVTPQTGPVIFIRHDGTDAVINANYYTGGYTGLRVEVGGQNAIRIDTNHFVSFPYGFNAAANSQIYGGLFYVTSSTTPLAGGVIGLSHTGSEAVLESTDYTGGFKPLSIKTGGAEVVRILETGIANFASNAAAITGGLAVNTLYRNGDTLCIVH